MKFHLIEPERGYTLLQKSVALSETHSRIAQFAPTGADIFTFMYPVFLVVIYVKGIVKKQLQLKEGAIFIFLSCFISVLVNISIQSFFLKNRPNIELFNGDIGETLLHTLLPNSSFPSDHAVVGMSIAIATLIRGYQIRSRLLITLGYVFVGCALIMGFCRIVTVVHRPSDILGGLLIGILIPLSISSPFLFPHFKRWFIVPLVKLQEWVFSRFVRKSNKAE